MSMVITQIREYVRSDGSIGTERRTADWHLGQPLVGSHRLKFEPQPVVYYEAVWTIIEIQVDGDELAAVIAAELLPFVPKLPVIRWFGETAQFIVANLGR